GIAPARRHEGRGQGQEVAALRPSGLWWNAHDQRGEEVHVTRRLAVASAIAVVLAAAFLPGSGVGSAAAAGRGALKIPAGRAAAIHARLGDATISTSWATRAPQPGPELGVSVALSADGTTALVGAPGAGNQKGAAYIYHVSDAGSWTSSDTPTAALTSN